MRSERIRLRALARVGATTQAGSQLVDDFMAMGLGIPRATVNQAIVNMEAMVEEAATKATKRVVFIGGGIIVALSLLLPRLLRGRS